MGTVEPKNTSPMSPSLLMVLDGGVGDTGVFLRDPDPAKTDPLKPHIFNLREPGIMKIGLTLPRRLPLALLKVS